MSLKAGLVFILGALLPLLLTNLLSARRATRHAHVEAEKRLSAVLSARREALGNHLDGLERLATAAATGPAAIEFLQGNLEARDRAVEALLPLQESHWGTIHHVMLADTKGKVVLSPGHAGSHKSHLNQTLPPEVFGGGLSEVRMTGFFGFSEAEHFHALMAAPVKASDGSTVGVAVLEIHIGAVLSLLGDEQDGQLSIFLTTPDGRKVTHEKDGRETRIERDGIVAATQTNDAVVVRSRDGDREIFGTYVADPTRPWVVGVEEDIEALDAPARAAWTEGILVLGGGVVVLALLGIWFGRHLSSPIKEIADAAHAMAAGDLTVQVEPRSECELGQLAIAFNESVAENQRLVLGVRSAVAEVEQRSRTLNASATSLMGGADAARSEVEEAEDSVAALRLDADVSVQEAKAASDGAEAVAQATEAVTSATAELAASAQEISDEMRSLAPSLSDLVATTDDVAQAGMRAAKASEAGTQQARGLAQHMAVLSKSAKKIEKVVGLVEELAERTNLLALNAAIEAASAGPAGRGFAVVADEVKQLARQTSCAVGKIAEQVEAIRDAADTTQTGLGAAAKGAEEATHLNAKLAAIVTEQGERAREMASMMASAVARSAERAETMADSAQRIIQKSSETDSSTRTIASNASELATRAQSVQDATGRVGTHIDTLRSMANRTAEEATELTSAADTLSGRAEVLSTLILRFQV